MRETRSETAMPVRLSPRSRERRRMERECGAVGAADGVRFAQTTAPVREVRSYRIGARRCRDVVRVDRGRLSACS